MSSLQNMESMMNIPKRDMFRDLIEKINNSYKGISYRQISFDENIAIKPQALN